MLLPQSFYLQNTLVVAQSLLGCFLCRKIGSEVRRYKIVETEAYRGPKDLASHASKGKTLRTAVMFGPPGYTYIYLVYGMHYMLNVVTEAEGYPAAVLIRAVQPVLRQNTNNHIAVETRHCLVSRHRNVSKNNTPTPETRQCLVSTNGPAKLTKTLCIDRSLNNSPIFNKTYGLWITAGTLAPDEKIKSAPRVGVDYAKEYRDKPWRFYIENNPFVSRR